MAETYIAELGYRVDTRPLKRGEQALDNVTKAGQRTESSISKVSSSVGVLSAGIAALAANSVINGVIRYSDSWTLVNNQLKLVIDNESDLIRKRGELIQLSKETNANLGSTVALYSELYRSTRELGTSEEDVSKVTRTLNNLFVSGGKDAQTQAGAIRQLSQALGAGALRGDEFNSVAEAAPRILDALSKSLGIGKGELRDFAATGGITAEILIDAVTSYSEQAQAMADRTSQTFEQAIENATTNVTAYVGASQAITDATMALGGAIESVTEDIDAIVNGITAAASVIAVSAIPSMISYTASVYANIQAQLLANTQAVRTVSALGSVTVAAGTATVATNALAMATRFLLSPWGLLLGAVSAAGIAYSMTNDKAKDFNDTLDIQNDLLDEATKKVKMLSDFQKADVALSARFKLTDNLKEQAELEQQILSDSFDQGAIASLTLKKQERLNELKAEEARLEGIIKAANEKPTTEKKKPGRFDSSIFDTDTVDTFALQQSKDYDKWLESISTTTTEIQRLRNEIELTQSAIDAGDLDADIGKEYIDNLNGQLKQLDVSPFDAITNSTKDGLSSIQSLATQGSKEYQKLGIAIQAVNAIQAISAVLNQAGGDPYTAFARMAAMAASVASLGYSVGGLSGGFDDVAAERQASQGTNVWGEKSESIANGIDIIANASEKLVGINTNMLKALTSVQNGISKAAALIGRDVEIPTASVNVRENLFSGLQNFFSGDVLNLTGILGDTFTELLNLPLNIIGKWLGGSSKVVDEGIQILGGSLGDMMDSITVEAFQQVQYKKWRFGSKKNKTATNDITSEVGDQFQLVLSSIADSVYEGATMLGLSGEEVQKAIQNFEIETQKISLKGLSAEEQQAEIEAVFSTIFDGLAGEVVPFLGEFQMAGESLGETLARVATQVNVLDLIVDQLGVTMFDKFSNPQAYAEAADNISDLVGGIESLAEKTSGFINSFAPEATKIDIYQNSLTDSLSAVGLSLPETAEGFWELMQSLDGSTTAGQEQIAALLNAQGTAKEYYDLIEKGSDKIAEAAKRYRDAIGSMYDVTEEMAAANLDAALRAARMGDLSLAEDLDLGSIAPDSSNYSSRLEYELARADTTAKLEELAKITEGTISVDEKQLETLEQIRDAIEQTSTIGNSKETKLIAKEMSELSNIQKQQSRTIADSNALLQQMVIDGIPVRVEA